MLSGIAGEGSKAGITIVQGDKTILSETEIAAIGYRPLIEISVTIDGKKTTWNNPYASDGSYTLYADSTFYTGYLAAAKRLGISVSVGNLNSLTKYNVLLSKRA